MPSPLPSEEADYMHTSEESVSSPEEGHKGRGSKRGASGSASGSAAGSKGPPGGLGGGEGGKGPEAPTPTWGRTRLGIPGRALVMREGRGEFTVSPEKTFTTLQQALSLRLEALSEEKLPLDTLTYLPFEAQVRVQKRLRNAWMETELGKTVQEQVACDIVVLFMAVTAMSSLAWD